MPNNFSLIISGEIKLIKNKAWLTTDSGTTFRLKGMSITRSTSFLGQAVPNTAPDAKITTLNISSLSPITLQEDEEIDSCHLIGKIIQFSSKINIVTVVVNEGDDYNEFTITLKTNGNTNKFNWSAGEVWKISATREEDYLLVNDANRLTIEQYNNIKTLANQDTDLDMMDYGLTDTSTAVPIPVVLTDAKNEPLHLFNPRRRENPEHTTYDIASAAENSSIIGRLICYDDGSSKQVYFPHLVHEVVNGSPDNIDEKVFCSIKVLTISRNLSEASCIQILLGKYEIIIDCGLDIDGNLPNFDNIKSPDLLIITHTHNMGALLEFSHRYPSTKIVCSPLTFELAYGLTWNNSPNQVVELLASLQTVEPGLLFEILPDLNLKLINAGHTPGSTCIQLTYKERSLLYAPHFTTANSRFTNGISLQDIEKTDLLICNSILGVNTHQARKVLEHDFLTNLNTSLKSHKDIIILADPNAAFDLLFTFLTSPLLFTDSQKINIFLSLPLWRYKTLLFESAHLLPESTKNILLHNNYFLGVIQPLTNLDKSTVARRIIITDVDDSLGNNPPTDVLERLLDPTIINKIKQQPDNFVVFLPTLMTSVLSNLLETKTINYQLFCYADKVGLGQLIAKTAPAKIVFISQLIDEINDFTKKYDNLICPQIGKTINFSRLFRAFLRKDESSEIESQVEIPLITKTRKALDEPINDNDIEIQVGLEKIGNTSQLYLLTIPESLLNNPLWQVFVAKKTINFKLFEDHFIASLPKESVDLSINCCNCCSFYQSDICTNELSPLTFLKVDPTGICSQFSRG